MQECSGKGGVIPNRIPSGRTATAINGRLGKRPALAAVGSKADRWAEVGGVGTGRPSGYGEARSAGSGKSAGW
jgi:hypothetical protein